MGRIVQRRTWTLVLAASALAAGLGTMAGAAGGPAPSATSLGGGTLRVGIPVFKITPVRTPTVPVDFALEPRANLPVPLELDRCCLLRTLLSYNGEPTARGGAVLRPDLAEALPTESRDGRTWTFHLKRGLHYGPPLRNVEITAQDVIRAIERPIPRLPRTLRGLISTPDGYAPIEGLKAYRSGRAGTVSGLEAQDAHTLVVTLTRPTENLPYTFSLPFTAPLPAELTKSHRGLDLSRFLVSTGPYMIAGSERMAFNRPRRDQAPAAGYGPARSITLVRNPSWKPSTDSLRAAYADRIVITYGGTVGGAARQVDRGALDLVFDAIPPRWQMARYRGSSALRRRLHANRSDVLYADTMNLAVPPFDDVRVRRAVNLAIDKRRLLSFFERSPEASFWGGTGVPAGHLIVDGLENDLLRPFDPYMTPGERGSLALARREMGRSRYDRNHDGRCDGSVCTIVALTHGGAFWPQWARETRRDLLGIGIHLRVRVVSERSWQAGVQFDPARRWPMLLGISYFKDFPSASTLFDFFDGRALGPTTSMMGASPAKLGRLGYPVRHVPNVDDRIDRCRSLPGLAGTNCWAALDEYLMLRVVPWVPLVFPTTTRVVSARVKRFSFDQLSNFPALDRIAVSTRR